jgi:hypothetical protein
VGVETNRAARGIVHEHVDGVSSHGQRHQKLRASRCRRDVRKLNALPRRPEPHAGVRWTRLIGVPGAYGDATKTLSSSPRVKLLFRSSPAAPSRGATGAAKRYRGIRPRSVREPTESGSGKRRGRAKPAASPAG